MELEVVRFSSQKDSTNGLLFNVTDGWRKFLCYTLEDEHRCEKEMHETRIPAGTYKLKLRNVGGTTKRYEKKYGDMHKGMIHVQDVPNFRYILWHTGNTDEHTAGCLLLGDTSQQNINKEGFIGGSTSAYKRVYPIIANALVKGEQVRVKYIDFDTAIRHK